MVPRKTLVSQNFGPISKLRLVFGWFLRLGVLNFFFVLCRKESRICRFFGFPFGLQKSTFSEIMGTAYRTELADYWESLPLAFSFIFFSFICAIISKFSALRVLASKSIKTQSCSEGSMNYIVYIQLLSLHDYWSIDCNSQWLTWNHISLTLHIEKHPSPRHKLL